MRIQERFNYSLYPLLTLTVCRVKYLMAQSARRALQCSNSGVLTPLLI